MKINDAGRKLLKEFEGLRLQAYQDIAHIWTIGYGHTGVEVKAGMEITEAQAEELLAKDLETFERDVERSLKVQVSPNQFSALVCFAYNLGIHNLRQSTLLNCINKHNIAQAANEFLRWTKAGGNVVPGLVRRREAERSLFLAD